MREVQDTKKLQLILTLFYKPTHPTLGPIGKKNPYREFSAPLIEMKVGWWRSLEVNKAPPFGICRYFWAIPWGEVGTRM